MEPIRIERHPLEIISSHLPFDERLRLALVCREFAAVLRHGGLQWANISLNGQALGPPPAGQAPRFWAGLLAWFTPRGASVRQLAIRNFRAPLRLPGPGAQRAALGSLFGLLPGLRELRVARCPAATSSEVLAETLHLTSLQELAVDVQGPLHTKHIDVLAVLPLLERLSVTLVRTLDGSSRFEGPFPACLTQLRGLKKLALESPYFGFDSAQRPLPEGIDVWSQMTHLRLVNLGLEEIPEAIGELSSLEELCLGRNQLGEHGHTALPDSITRLTKLRRLELQYNHFEELGPPPVIGHLTTLEELNLGGNTWGGSVPDLPPEFAQLLRLRYLTLTNCALTVLPPVVANLGSLELLKLNLNRLQELPPGPYLGSLQMIDIAHNAFLYYLPVLSTALHLKTVGFQYNDVHYSDPALAAQQAPAPAGQDGPAQGGPFQAQQDAYVAMYLHMMQG